ncbi:hypothetical protein KXX11_000247 [Aspergillus fumigatus]|nr:hypothetical protein KXX11_000247 [Aspergillus fumigatus]
MSYGKSLALSQNSFVQPPDQDDGARDTQGEPVLRRQKRQATVYDAVAGRVNAHGFLPSVSYASKHRDTASSSSRPVRPEEVLFRRQNAPIRYEENDFYFANESLPADCPLPTSDLLEAIHAYTADFYDHATIDRGQDDYQSMDETALIAMGILMEEMAREALGETGDLVLVEGEELSTDDDHLSSRLKSRRIGRKRANTSQSMILASSGDDLDSVPPKLSKSAKEDLIVSHLRSTRTCHTLKDLEKMLPSVASINGMQVKEYIQNLTDEGKIRVEKIGSGNWYWCFGGDEKREKQARLNQLEKEVKMLQASYDEAEASLADKRAKWEEEGEDEQSNLAEREELARRKGELEKERNRLQAQWIAATTTEEGNGVQEMREEIEEFRKQALMWTDNIYVLEGYLSKLAGGDREIIAAVQRECYGDEYVEGEGLSELTM